MFYLLAILSIVSSTAYGMHAKSATYDLFADGYNHAETMRMIYVHFAARDQHIESIRKLNPKLANAYQDHLYGQDEALLEDIESVTANRLLTPKQTNQLRKDAFSHKERQAVMYLMDPNNPTKLTADVEKVLIKHGVIKNN